jgi:hypothetical protein
MVSSTDHGLVSVAAENFCSSSVVLNACLAAHQLLPAMVSAADHSKCFAFCDSSRVDLRTGSIQQSKKNVDNIIYCAQYSSD